MAQPRRLALTRLDQTAARFIARRPYLGGGISRSAGTRKRVLNRCTIAMLSSSLARRTSVTGRGVPRSGSCPRKPALIHEVPDQLCSAVAAATYSPRRQRSDALALAAERYRPGHLHPRARATSGAERVLQVFRRIAQRRQLLTSIKLATRDALAAGRSRQRSVHYLVGARTHIGAVLPARHRVTFRAALRTLFRAHVYVTMISYTSGVPRSAHQYRDR